MLEHDVKQRLGGRAARVVLHHLRAVLEQLLDHGLTALNNGEVTAKAPDTLAARLVRDWESISSIDVLPKCATLDPESLAQAIEDCLQRGIAQVFLRGRHYSLFALL